MRHLCSQYKAFQTVTPAKSLPTIIKDIVAFWQRVNNKACSVEPRLTGQSLNASINERRKTIPCFVGYWEENIRELKKMPALQIKSLKGVLSCRGGGIPKSSVLFNTVIPTCLSYPGLKALKQRCWKSLIPPFLRKSEMEMESNAVTSFGTSIYNVQSSRNVKKWFAYLQFVTLWRTMGVRSNFLSNVRAVGPWLLNTQVISSHISHRQPWYLYTIHILWIILFQCT